MCIRDRVTDVQAEVKKAVSKKPESLEEYLPVGRYYAAKKLLLALLIAAILLPILYFKFVHPAVTALSLIHISSVSGPHGGEFSGKWMGDRSGPEPDPDFK